MDKAARDVTLRERRRNRGSSGRTGRSGEEVRRSDDTRQQIDRRKPERKEDSGKLKIGTPLLRVR